MIKLYYDPINGDKEKDPHKKVSFLRLIFLKFKF